MSSPKTLEELRARYPGLDVAIRGRSEGDRKVRQLCCWDARTRHPPLVPLIEECEYKEYGEEWPPVAGLIAKVEAEIAKLRAALTPVGEEGEFRVGDAVCDVKGGDDVAYGFVYERIECVGGVVDYMVEYYRPRMEYPQCERTHPAAIRRVSRAEMEEGINADWRLVFEEIPDDASARFAEDLEEGEGDGS